MRDVSLVAEESSRFKNGLDSKEFLIYAGEKKKKLNSSPPHPELNQESTELF